MQGAIKRISGPAYMGSSVADIYTPPASTILTVINQIRIANVTAGAVTYTLYVGGTGGSTGGTELAKGVSIPANSVVDLYFSPGLKMSSTDFLSGLASAGSSLTITVMGKQSCVES
jgi:hypothetical protein